MKTDGISPVSDEEIRDSVALRRLIEEVQNETHEPPAGYNRTYNRWMKPGDGGYNRTYNRHNR